MKTRYAVEPGRWITRDGVPLFAIMLSSDRQGWGHFGPSEVEPETKKESAL